jgi:hypothetical protein
VKRDRGKRKWCRGLGLASEIQYLRDGLNILQCEWISARTLYRTSACSAALFEGDPCELLQPATAPGPPEQLDRCRRKKQSHKRRLEAGKVVFALSA